MGLPPRRREVRNHTLDSTRWGEFRFRAGDIVAGTWAKAGTTWILQILAHLLLPGAARLPVLEIAPWIDQRCLPKEPMFARLEAQTHRRFVKTHLPADSLIFSPLAQYIYVARDGRDALWSWHNHHRSLTPHALRLINEPPGRVGPPLGPANPDVQRYFHDWLDGDGYPLWPFWSHVQSWWDIRNRPNVLLVHFNNLKADLALEMQRIARFLAIPVEAARWPGMVERCSFDYMKENASLLSPTLDLAFTGGAGTFLYKGTNGRWRDILSDDDVRKYERAARRNLSADCAAWLVSGQSRSNGPPQAVS